jgi:hypothetical protein
VYIVYVARRRRRHPHKEIEKALQGAEQAGFAVVEVMKGHVWGRVVAPNRQELTVWSTPRSPETMAKRVREFVRRHRR